MHVLKSPADSGISGSTNCDSKWQSMQGSSFCYKLNQVKLNWTDADAYCKSNGAQLVSVQSKYVDLYSRCYIDKILRRK